MFYQLKITRKGTKPPIWRRRLIPADINFEKLAEMLQDILEYQSTDLYEIEFFSIRQAAYMRLNFFRKKYRSVRTVTEKRRIISHY